MARIIAGRFDATSAADAALEDLKRDGFARGEVDSFYVSPPGAHDLTRVGGDVHSSAGSRFAGRGALIGAVIGVLVGALAGVVVSSSHGVPAGVLAALLGALIGAFAGTMSSVRGGRRSEATREHPVEPLGGRMIAVLVERAGTEPRAIEILRRHGARNVSRAYGEWRDGSWQDFDPRAPLAAV
jgi:uncharacterized membrane protein YeaQ/YmgE (transglycosylase-associated protein family)